MATNDDALVGYTIYTRPRDWPQIPFVVRPWCVYTGLRTPPHWPFVRPATDAPGVFYHPIMCICGSLADAREPFRTAGLARVHREPTDDAIIAEVWV